MVRWCSNICLQSCLPAASLAFMSCFSTTLQRFKDDSSGSLTLSEATCHGVSSGALLPPWQPSSGKLQAPGGLILSGDILWHSFSLVSLVIPPCVMRCQLQPPSATWYLSWLARVVCGSACASRASESGVAGRAHAGAFCQGELCRDFFKELISTHRV